MSVELGSTVQGAINMPIPSQNPSFMSENWRFSSYSSIPDTSFTFLDPMYGNVVLESYLGQIIDTPEFQRLANISQLGPCKFVFRGATHTRFSHSIGVCHLAGRMLDSIIENQEDVDLTDNDMKCVKIAALCHDLGHGPFSHDFQNFMIRARKMDWKHEESSVAVFKYLVEKNNLNLAEWGLRDLDILFIHEMIVGTPFGKRIARPHARQSFLYDIVTNRLNGLDVDRLDYIQRDAVSIGLIKVWHFSNFIDKARVCWVEPVKGSSLRATICWPKSMLRETLDIFSIRSSLFSTIYHNINSECIALMIMDILDMADHDGFRINGKSLFEAVDDPETFCKLTDTVIDLIDNYPCIDLRRSREIMARVLCRELYMRVGCILSDYKEMTLSERIEVEDEIQEEIVRISSEFFHDDEEEHQTKYDPTYDRPLENDDIIVQFKKVNWSVPKETLLNIFYYEKRCKKKLGKAYTYPLEEYAKGLPPNLTEMYIVVYARNPRHEPLISNCLEVLCNRKKGLKLDRLSF